MVEALKVSQEEQTKALEQIYEMLVEEFNKPKPNTDQSDSKAYTM